LRSVLTFFTRCSESLNRHSAFGRDPLLVFLLHGKGRDAEFFPQGIAQKFGSSALSPLIK